MLWASGYTPLLNFSFMTKLINRPLSLSINSPFSQPSGKEITSFQWMGDLGTNLSATGCDLMEAASSEGMSSGLQACCLENTNGRKIIIVDRFMSFARANTDKTDTPMGLSHRHLPLSGHVESQENKKLCFSRQASASREFSARLAVQKQSFSFSWDSSWSPNL